MTVQVRVTRVEEEVEVTTIEEGGTGGGVRKSNCQGAKLGLGYILGGEGRGWCGQVKTGVDTDTCSLSTRLQTTNYRV